jgi:hypothetical protein
MRSRVPPSHVLSTQLRHLGHKRVRYRGTPGRRAQAPGHDALNGGGGWSRPGADPAVGWASWLL